MAIIGTIRKNSWILVVGIGGALAAFIIMTMIQNGNKNRSNNQMNMGEVNGKKISRKEFERTYNVLYGNSQGDANGRRAYLWNYFVEEGIIFDQADKMGLGVSKDEMANLEFGPTPSRIIVQRFPSKNNPQAVDRTQLNNFKSIIEEHRIQEAIQNREISPNFVPFWKHQRREITKDRLQTKMDNLVSKAMYVPTWMANMGFNEQNEFIDFTVTKVPFDEIDPSEISLTDADYQKYVDDHAATYYQEEETRVVDYVTFDIIPSSADSLKSKSVVEKLIPEFKSTESDSSFVLRYDGVIDEVYYKKSELSPVIADTLMTLPVGTVYGPYMEDGMYKIVKILDKKIIPDSVRARHILRQASTFQEYAQAKSTIDSLKNLIETGAATFDSLAVKFGTDATASKGGDLGYTAQGRMVKPFNDLIFYKAKKGELNTVATQFGLHLVEVTGQKFVTNTEGLKVAYISEPIVPSKETEDAVFDKASQFVAKNRNIENFRTAANEMGLKISTSNPLKANDYQIDGLGSGPDARNIVRWAFQSKLGEVSGTVYSFKDPGFLYDNKFVSAALALIQEKGVPNAMSIKDQIQTLVLNEKRGEKLATAMKGMDMESIAAKYKVPIDTATHVSFSAPYVAQIGAGEYKVQGKAFTLGQDQTSEPIIGKSGVFVIKVIKKPTVATPSAAILPQIRQTILKKDRSRVPGQLIKGLRKNSDIEDNRS